MSFKLSKIRKYCPKITASFLNYFRYFRYDLSLFDIPSLSYPLFKNNTNIVIGDTVSHIVLVTSDISKINPFSDYHLIDPKFPAIII